MKKILGLDLGTNSIGWALIEQDFDHQEGHIDGAGSRIIPMAQDVMGKFDSGVSISQTAERTHYRGVRRLYQRNNLRRERLHRVLNILQFLPEHYAKSIDFEHKLGQFKPGTEVKLNYQLSADGLQHEFIFTKSFNEMVNIFQKNGQSIKIPYDWTIYYLRQKAVHSKVTKEELAWILLNFNQKRGYYQLRGEDLEEDNSKEFKELTVKELIDTGENVKGKTLYNVVFTNGWQYDKLIVNTQEWIGRSKEFIVTTKTLKDGTTKRTYKAVDSEVDWVAIKAKTEQDIERSELTVGEYIFKELLRDPFQKIRGKLVKTIERKFYKKELIKILAEQKKHHPEFSDAELYNDSIQELYSRNTAHQANIRNKDLVYLFIEDIIFYQRPLRSQKGSISGCQYEYRTFKVKDKNTGVVKELKDKVKVISKSNPMFQEFRLWQWIDNLRIFQKEDPIDKTLLDQDITNSFFKSEEDWVELFEYLTTKREMDQKGIINYLVKQGLIPKADKDNYRWNYVEDKKYPMYETRNQILTRLRKVEGNVADEFLTPQLEHKLWHIIYSVSDKHEYLQALRNFAKKHAIDEQSFTEQFASFPPFSSDYGSYSKKAINKLLPLMRMGDSWSEKNIDQNTATRIEKLINAEYDEKIKDRVREKIINLGSVQEFRGLPLWLATYVVYDRHAEGGDIQKWESPSDIDEYLSNFKQHSLRNPIVEQVVTETLRVVRDIWIHFGAGKKDFFNEIHLELGREMKNPAKKREEMSKRNTQNENTNIRIREILKELTNDHSIEGSVLSYSPSHQEILKIYEEGLWNNPNADFSTVSEDEVTKIRRSNNPSKTDITRYKLWLSQGYISPYTGRVIPLSRLFTTAYQIEHIIPQSRYFDNSLSNKIICESGVNQDKDNKTAYEYLKEKGGSIVDGKHKLLTLEDYEVHCNHYFKKNRIKLKNLLSEDIPEGFIERQLNDGRYISKFIKSLLSNIVRTDNEQERTSKNLIPVSGQITARLKRDWGLNDQWNELIAPRFMRMNELTNSSDFGNWDEKIQAFRSDVPDDLKKGFSKKRIDHRHHALDAIVIACTHRKHIQYLNSLNNDKIKYELKSSLFAKNDDGRYSKHFLKPWKTYTLDVKNQLLSIITSFKSNTRVLNKTNNKTWQWLQLNDGSYKKQKIKQTKGDNWAIRKPLHKETVSGLLNIDTAKGKIATASRVSLSAITNKKVLEKITDISIQKILVKHLESYKDEKGKHDYSAAFSAEGVEDLNKNIVALNMGKNHQPIKKVRLMEIGSKFPVGVAGNNNTKYVEAAKGTNLYFAIYWDEEKKKRVYETIPLHEVVEHQKQVAHLPKSQRLPIQPNPELGRFLFSLSPNDLVYVPTDEEIANDNKIQLRSVEQIDRIYKMVSSTGKKCHFVKHSIASLVMNYNSKKKLGELGSLNKLETSFDGIRIKQVCWKIKIDRIGKSIILDK